MKYFNDSLMFDEAISFTSLHDSYLSCLKGVKWKDSVAKFAMNAVVEISDLRSEIIDMEYRMKEPILFIVHEPKERIIQSLIFRDKVFQKSLCDNILVPIFNKVFIYDNGASVKNKGYSFSINRLHAHLRKYYNDNERNNEGWILKCDIHHYFDSINHDILMDMVEEYLSDERLLFYLRDSIAMYGENNTGLGLGSQINQTFALLYLNKLDHFIKEKLHIKYYGRYMDDFYLLHSDKEYLKYCRDVIEEELTFVKLKLSEKKTQLFPIKHGLKFLGFTHNLTDTGKIYMKIDRTNVSRERRRLRKMRDLRLEGKISIEDICASYTSWKAHVKRGNSYYLLQKMDRYFLELFYPFILDEYTNRPFVY